MISLSNIKKTYGEQLLFEAVTFNINPGEKIGLVGRNGHGKTTLLRILLGEEDTDSGIISIPKNYTIGCLKQNLEFSMPTVIEESCLGLKKDERDNKWIAEKILSGLGFSDIDMNRNPLEFSGGFQVRINLAKLLVSSPDLLLLDEPSNYLDIISIRWLIKFLREWKNEFIIITHDRNLMDAVTTHTLAIHRNTIKKIEGNTEKMYQQIAKEEEIYEKTRINDDKKRKEIEVFINRFRAKATLSSRVQSREKLLEKNDRLQKLDRIKDLEFCFNYEPIYAKSFFSADNISFSYKPTEKIIDNFSINISRDDRIAIIGKNGKGKTTLLKILSQKLEPLSGIINKHSGVKVGYFEQTNIELLDKNKTVEEEIDCSITNRDRYTARNICGAMMFEQDMALKKIAVLSGGEKSRVMLGKLIATPVNLLLLDEPTNHLDMQSADSLLEALEGFDGAVIIATHNEMFLNDIANRLIIFDRDGITVFEGTYPQFLDKIGWRDEDEINNRNNREKDTVKKKDIRKLRAEIIEEKSKAIKPIENKIKKIENEIFSLEEELHMCHSEFENATYVSDGEKIRTLSVKISGLENQINDNYNSLSEYTDEFDKLSAMFEEKLLSI